MFDFFESIEQNNNFAKTVTISTVDEDGSAVVEDYQIAYLLPNHGANRPRYAMAVKANEVVPCLLYLIQLPAGILRNAETVETEGK